MRDFSTLVFCCYSKTLTQNNLRRIYLTCKLPCVTEGCQHRSSWQELNGRKCCRTHRGTALIACSPWLSQFVSLHHLGWPVCGQHCPHLALPTHMINQEDAPKDLLKDQFDTGNSSSKGHFSHMTAVCITLMNTNKSRTKMRP